MFLRGGRTSKQTIVGQGHARLCLHLNFVIQKTNYTCFPFMQQLVSKVGCYHSESRRSQMPGAGFCSSVAPEFSSAYFMLQWFQLQAALLSHSVFLQSSYLPAPSLPLTCSQSRLVDRHVKWVKSRSISVESALSQTSRKVKRRRENIFAK